MIRAAGTPRKPAALLVLLAFLLAAGCGPEGSGDGAAGEVRKNSASETVVELEPLDGSGTTGTVTLVPGDGGGSEIRLSLKGLPDPGGAYVGAVYRGSCSGGKGGQGVVPGRHAEYRFVHGNEGAPEDEEDVIQTLTSVASDPEGNGSSVTPLPTSTDELLSGTPKYVDVHGEEEAIACADLPVANT